MPERGRQQTETRQSQATLPSPREGAASVEGRALRHRGEPTGALSPPYPTLTGDLLGGLGTWLEGQSSFQPSLTAGLRAAGAEAASRGGTCGAAAAVRRRQVSRGAGGRAAHSVPMGWTPPGEGHQCVSPLLGTASRRKGQPTRAAGHRDAGSRPCQTRVGRTVHPGVFLCCSRKQLGKRRSYCLGTGEALPWSQAQSPSPGSTAAGSHGTQPATHTRHPAPALPPALTPTPLAPSLHPPAADPSASPYTHYYLGQASTDTPSTPWEINYPPCRWKSCATASSQRFSSRLADHGLRAATTEPPGLPAAEQAPGAALNLPITRYPPAAAASPRHSFSALPCSRDQSPAPTVLLSTPLTRRPLSTFVGDRLAPSLLSYCHRERRL